MPGLIWLWQGYGSAPPAVVVDYGVSPEFLEILNKAPSMGIEHTDSVFTTTTTTYNSVLTQYNSGTTLYGGSDRNTSPAPSIYGVIVDNVTGMIEDNVPEFEFIDHTNSVLTTSNLTYNQSDVQYSSSVYKYGGSDRNTHSGPTLMKVGS